MKIGKYGGGNMAQAQEEHVPFLFDKNLGAGLRLSASELTPTNSEGLAAQQLTEEQRFLFDAQGYLLVPGVLGADEVAQMKEFCYRLHTDKESIPEPERCAIGGPLQKLIDHPLVLGFMNEFVAFPHLANEHGYGFRLEGSFVTIRSQGVGGFGPHNGSGMMRLPGDSHEYRCFPGKAYSGLTRVVWELNPVYQGDGGTLLLPGSHKAAYPAPKSIMQPDSPLWVDYECPAGSVLFFTEALTHSGTPWKRKDYERVAVFNCYNTVNARWHNWEPHPDLLAAMPAKRRSLFRPVCCQDNLVVEG
ncbi:MAG: phytanoyl-CoA dioxygenase family protein [Candidatus Handelsmanbacteria bacterium]|nr:phytanoyl-CoA dioxygenase family protein [Candidatus Handelsmanbacteria bacterium]